MGDTNIGEAERLVSLFYDKLPDSIQLKQRIEIAEKCAIECCKEIMGVLEHPAVRDFYVSVINHIEAGL